MTIWLPAAYHDECLTSEIIIAFCLDSRAKTGTAAAQSVWSKRSVGSSFQNVQAVDSSVYYSIVYNVRHILSPYRGYNIRYYTVDTL
eukprot:4280129-Pleurochrysis_carterae.AAC.1